MNNKIDYTLYLVTDQKLMSTKTIEESVSQAIAGGCTLIQLREKELSSMEFYKTALNIQKITKSKKIPLIINDRVDIALAVNADGVHVGQDDLPAKVVRSIIGPDKIIGVSVSTLSEAIQAEEDGADYLGVGAMFTTDTKTDAKLVTIDELITIRDAISIPIVVIGGINEDTLPKFTSLNIDGIAVVSAVIAQKNITKSAKKIKKLFTKGRNISI